MYVVDLEQVSRSFVKQGRSTTKSSSFRLSKRQHTTNVSFPTNKRYKLAIAIVSGFDWEERPPYVSRFTRRQAHRKTWMQHPAVQNDDILVYFFIGNQEQQSGALRQGNPNEATHNITELQLEMDDMGDIVLLDSSDIHRNGKMNAWYEWASVNIQADYHMKLDDESYLRLDQLLLKLKQAPRQGFFGGYGQSHHRLYKGQNLTNLSWIRGWGYVMSQDLLKGLGDCSGSGRIEYNNGKEYEDMYNAVALRVCGLDTNITVWDTMPFEDFTRLFAYGCPAGMVDSILFHCGMIAGKTFAKFPDLTFARLDDIYHPEPGDLTPTWAKWEALRLLYMEDFGVCEKSNDWNCKGWRQHTCVPTNKTSS